MRDTWIGVRRGHASLPQEIRVWETDLVLLESTFTGRSRISATWNGGQTMIRGVFFRGCSVCSFFGRHDDRLEKGR